MFPWNFRMLPFDLRGKFNLYVLPSQPPRRDLWTQWHTPRPFPSKKNKQRVFRDATVAPQIRWWWWWWWRWWDDEMMMMMTNIKFSSNSHKLLKVCKLRRPSKATPLVPHGWLGCTWSCGRWRWVHPSHRSSRHAWSGHAQCRTSQF